MQAEPSTANFYHLQRKQNSLINCLVRIFNLDKRSDPYLIQNDKLCFSPNFYRVDDRVGLLHSVLEKLLRILADCRVQIHHHSDDFVITIPKPMGVMTKSSTAVGDIHPRKCPILMTQIFTVRPRDVTQC